MHNAPAIIDRFYELLKVHDASTLAMLYASDAEIIRYDGVASGRREIEVYYRGYLAGRPGHLGRPATRNRPPARCGRARRSPCCTRSTRSATTATC